VTATDLVAVDAAGCLAWASPRKLVALVGVEDLVVVDTEDALLVCPRSRAQDVKKVVDRLKELKRDDLL
jgi:mannose-1-phosphate guanylyltransferase